MHIRSPPVPKLALPSLSLSGDIQNKMNYQLLSRPPLIVSKTMCHFTQRLLSRYTQIRYLYVLRMTYFGCSLPVNDHFARHNKY